MVNPQTEASAAQGGLDVLNSALVALDCGLSVIPVGVDKKPLVPWAEFQQRLATPEEVEGWFSSFPGANVGIVTGELSGIDVLDFDVLGSQWPPAGVELPCWVVVRTPRGGLHYYIPHVPGARNSASVLAKGVDVRAEGGYVVAPPSRTPGGNYEFAVGDFAEAGGLRGGIGRLEGWLSDAVLGASSPTRTGKRKGTEPEAGEPGTLEEGCRNDALFRVALRLRHSGLAAAEVGVALRTLNTARCKPPLPESELEGLLTSVLRYKPKDSGVGPVPRDYPRTESGNAEFLASLYGAAVRFCHTDGQWMIWRGSTWRPDTTRYVFQAARKGARVRFEAALSSEGLNEAERKAEMDWARRSEGRHAMDNALALLAAEPGVATTEDQWDTPSHLAAFRGGVLDLSNRACTPNKPELLLRRRLGTRYQPDAICPRWSRFLQEVFPSSPEMPPFLQRLVGYSLTGAPTEQIWVLLLGRGANGKSVFLSVLKALFGEFASVLPFSALEQRAYPGIPNDLARLAGKRIAIASETGENASFDAAKLKALTGGETVTARFLNREFFEFVPRFVIWLASNKTPRVKDESEAFWRRACILPFKKTFLPEERDQALLGQLIKELPGIFNWALDGLFDYRERGLARPQEVLDAVADYRETSESLAEFFSECCVLGVGARGEFKELFALYKAWVASSGSGAKFALGRKSFAQSLSGRFEALKIEGRRFYAGIEPNPEKLLVLHGLLMSPQAQATHQGLGGLLSLPEERER